MSAITSTLALVRFLKDARLASAKLQPTIREKLKEVLIAAADVPRHREIMRQAGYDPRQDFGGLADLAMFPVMTKADLKRAPESFLQDAASTHLDDYFKDRTSGSTVMPLSVYRAPCKRDINIKPDPNGKMRILMSEAIK